MTNVINKISQSLIEKYTITEAFIVNGELYLTSDYDMPIETFNNLEESLLND